MGRTPSNPRHFAHFWTSFYARTIRKEIERADVDCNAGHYKSKTIGNSPGRCSNFPDGCSWHSRVSHHTLSFDQFWAVLGHRWMPAKKVLNGEYIHQIKKVTLVKTLSPTASIWTIQYGFSPPVSPQVFTVLQVTRLDPSTPRTGWVVHMPIDLMGPGDELLAQEHAGIKGRYACVEMITELAGGRTEWRLVTCSTPAGLIPKSLADKPYPLLPGRTSFLDAT